MVSIQVRFNQVNLGAEVGSHVKLEADTVDVTSFVLHVFDHVINDVGTGSIPVTVHSGVTIVIVEQLCVRVSFVCPFETIADEVLNFPVNSTPWGVGTDFVRSTVVNGLIDYVPVRSFAFVPSDRCLDVPLGKVLDLPGRSLPNPARIERVLVPEGGVTSKDHVILLSPLQNLITIFVVKISPALGNRLHLAVAFSRNQVVLLNGRTFVLPIGCVASHVPVLHSSAHVHTEALGIISESFRIFLNVGAE